MGPFLADQEYILEQATFRDPQGRLFHQKNRVLREIYPAHADTVLEWICSPLAQRWMEEGRLVPSRLLETREDGSLLLEHDRVFFPSYPWEWTAGQWAHAAALTLDLCEEALESGYILKDATPLNILFAGPHGIFVDVPSFERRDPGKPVWLAYAQFVRMFLLPLAANTHLGWPLAATLLRRDGYEPAILAPHLSFRQRWQSPFRSLVTLPLLLETSRPGKSAEKHAYTKNVDQELATAMLQRTLRSTRRMLAAVTPAPRTSRWSGYVAAATHYAAQDHSAKQDFVQRTLSTIRPAHVLDVGANTGTYSRLAAGTGADVVAWDTDAEAADLNWRQAREKGLPILPLLADFARPTPPAGWQNAEYPGLLARARGRFDCVLMLGVLHHLLISDQIPLPAILDQLASLTQRWAVLEWIPREDSQFAGLCRGREELYKHLLEPYFVRKLSEQFTVRNRELLSNGRTLWLVEKNE